MQPAIRVVPIDKSLSHATYPPSVPAQGSQTVFINGFPAVRQGDPYTPHINSVLPHDTHNPTVAQGSQTVFIEGLPACRAGDPLSCGDFAANGSQDVFIG